MVKNESYWFATAQLVVRARERPLLPSRVPPGRHV